MTISEILKALQPYTGRFPMQAMQAAIEQREAITTELLRVLEAAADDPVEYAEREDDMLPVFSLFLLAQFREKRAYPLAIKIFNAPGDVPFDLFGDTVTEGLSQIFGSIYDGNPAPLEMLVESEDVNEYVRGAAIDAFLVLEHSGQMPREHVISYFRSLFNGRLKRIHSHAWNSMISAAADMPAPELIEDVRQAYSDGLVDHNFADLKGIERDLLLHDAGRRDRHYVVTDAIAEMEWWASFHLDETQPHPIPNEETTIPGSSLVSPTVYAAPKPFVGGPYVGRNDPCPCGSGKKYKKCCG